MADFILLVKILPENETTNANKEKYKVEKKIDEIRAIHQEHQVFYQFLGGGLLVSIGIGIGWILFADEGMSYFTNIWTELMGIVVTLTLVDRLIQYRNRQSRILELRERLKREAASPSNEIAKQAIHELFALNWLQDNRSLLMNSNLSFANLEGSRLSTANLAHADLHRANLSEGYLRKANLREVNLYRATVTNANLRYCDLRGANLNFTDLRGSRMTDADLRGADFTSARLENVNLHRCIADGSTILPNGEKLLSVEDFKQFGAMAGNLAGEELRHYHFSNTDLRNENLEKTDFRGTNLERSALEGANLANALFDELTIMPDGKNWGSDTDIRRFTDSSHPDFWKPKWS